MQTAHRPTIAIIGAGFGGLNAAQALANQPVDVLLIDRQNFHLFSPLLYQVATSGLDPSEIAYPVRGIFKGKKNVRFLMGDVRAIDRTAKQISEGGIDADMAKLRSAYFETRVLAPKQYASSVRLLSIFAEHLSMVSNQVVVQQQTAEPPVITRAKQFIHEHQGEDLSLGQVAKAVNTSTFYFCKMFKKATGVNFTDYLSRVRIEKAKNLLLNPNLRISEIAYEVGFQSLTHFNRVFKKIVGQSPTEYRGQLPTD